MILRIKTHNLLNGLVFSVAEFLFIALIVSPFAFYYITHGRVIYALVAIEIFLNCLTVAFIAWRQRSHNEKDIGLRRALDKKEREKIGRASPNLLGDTLMITITALVPYVLTVFVVYELSSGRARIS